MAGGFGGSKSKSSSSQSSNPWIGQQPYLKDVFSQAQNLFNQGPPGYYPGATYTPFNDIQQGAFDATLNRAQGSSQEQNYGNFLDQALTDPRHMQAQNQGNFGLMQAQQGYGLGQAQQFARSGVPTGQGNPFLQNLASAENPTLRGRVGDIQGSLDPRASATLGDTASGSYLNANPYLNAQFNDAAGNVGEQFSNTVLPGLNQTFGAAGRTGSRSHTGAIDAATGRLGDTLSGLATDIYGGNYAQERQNQLAAAGTLGDQSLAGAGLGADVYKADAARQLGAAGLTQEQNQFDSRLGFDQNQLAANIYGSDRNRAAAASQALQQGGLQGYGQQLQAGSQVSDHSALQWQNIANALGIGDRVQGQSDQILQDDINRFDYYQGAPWENLARYAATIFGAGGLTESSGKSKSKELGFDVTVG